MRRIPLLVLILSCAFASGAAAQGTPSTRDSIRMAEVQEPEEVDGEAAVDEDDAEPDTVPEPAAGPYARSGGTGPFSVQASGQVAPRPERGEVVWVSAAPAPRVTARDSARRDTARAGTRVTSGQTARRDSASATRPAPRDTARTGSRVSANQPARRDTSTSTRPQNRPPARDTARTGSRVSTNQPARRDTSASTRPQNRPPARDTAAARRNDGGRTGTAAAATGRTGPTAAPSGRSRTHTVAAGETFYAIARRYGVTAAQLRALNPDVDMDALEVGDALRLPAAARDSRAGAQPRPQAPAAGTGAQTQQPRRGTRSHVVAAGETLFGIARRYGVTVDAIRRANEMETDQVRTGQRLVIPPAS
ncbi:MAG TPA: LysM peptidoglycan-binding domain-containing protein [Longimicrobium sp.]